MIPRPLRTTVVALAALGLLAGCAGAPSSAPSDAQAAAFAAAMAQPLTTWRESPESGPLAFTIPGTVTGAAAGDGVVVVAGSGEGAPGEALSGDEAFHIGSMTKLFTAALIMQLDQEGVVPLATTIDAWFPEAPNADAITVQMLLEHMSGLYELDFDLVGHVTPQQLIDDVFLQTPISAPGEAYQYLNAGYILLGRIAELGAGKPYEELVRTRFIAPLGLASTYVDGEGTGPEGVHGFDLLCDAGSGLECVHETITLKPVASSPQWTGAWSAGGMVSTARDQAVWLRALVAGDVLDAEHRRLMRELTPLSAKYYGDAYAKAGIPAVQLGEGAGLASWEVPGVGVCHGHAGAIPGANGVGAHCPESGLTIVVLNAIDPAGASPGYPGLLELAPAALEALQEL